MQKLPLLIFERNCLQDMPYTGLGHGLVSKKLRPCNLSLSHKKHGGRNLKNPCGYYANFIYYFRFAHLA
jgi:hypothetical protein